MGHPKGYEPFWRREFFGMEEKSIVDRDFDIPEPEDYEDLMKIYLDQDDDDVLAKQLRRL